MPKKAPFPYHGGKSKVADIVRKRLGHINHYIEPFCGSCAVLLSHPPVKYETVNDINGLLVNFWRAVKHNPEKVAEYAKGPTSDIELKSRHNWVYNKKDVVENLHTDPEWHHNKLAGYWLYTMSTMIGQRGIFNEEIGLRLPKISRPHGLHSKDRKHNLVEILNNIAERIEKLRITCQDWSNILTTTTLKNTATPVGVFLDPPYQKEEYDSDVYEHKNDVFEDVVNWCLEYGDKEHIKTALCGYEQKGFEMPDNWQKFSWSTNGGMGNISRGGQQKGIENKTRERIWFSPGCNNPESLEGTLLGDFKKNEEK